MKYTRLFALQLAATLIALGLDILGLVFYFKTGQVSGVCMTSLWIDFVIALLLVFVLWSTIDKASTQWPLKIVLSLAALVSCALSIWCVTKIDQNGVEVPTILSSFILLITAGTSFIEPTG